MTICNRKSNPIAFNPSRHAVDNRWAFVQLPSGIKKPVVFEAIIKKAAPLELIRLLEDPNKAEWVRV